MLPNMKASGELSITDAEGLETSNSSWSTYDGDLIEGDLAPVDGLRSSWKVSVVGGLRSLNRGLRAAAAS